MWFVSTFGPWSAYRSYTYGIHRIQVSSMKLPFSALPDNWTPSALKDTSPSCQTHNIFLHFRPMESPTDRLLSSCRNFLWCRNRNTPSPNLPDNFPPCSLLHSLSNLDNCNHTCIPY